MSSPKITYSNTVYRNDGLYPRTIILSSKDPSKPTQVYTLQPGQKFDLTQPRFSGYTLSTEIGNFLDEKEILKQAAVLDTETLGKGRGSTITEYAILYRNEKGRRQLDVIIPQIDYLIARKASLEERAVSGAGDRFVSLRKIAPDVFRGDKSRNITPVIDTTLDIQYLKMLLEGSTGKRIGSDPSRLTGGAFSPDEMFDIRQAFERVYGETAKQDDYVTIARNLQNILNAELDNRPVRDVVVEAFRREEKFQAKYYYDDLQQTQRFSSELKKAIAFLSDSDKTLTQELVAQVIDTQRDITGISSSDIDIRVHHLDRESSLRKLSEVLKGKVTFIANAAFEAKQVGAQLNSVIEEGIDELIAKIPDSDKLSEKELAKKRKIIKKQMLLRISETDASNSSAGRLVNELLGATNLSASTGEPFYVSGQEYSIDRLRAFTTGDFSGLTRSLLSKTRLGDTRDILDLVRAQQSQLINLGLLDSNRPMAIGIEVQARLYKAAEIAAKEGEQKGLEALVNLKELHRAYADTILEDIVTVESIEQGKLLGSIQRREIDFASADREVLKKSLYYSRFFQEAISSQADDLLNLEQISFRQFAGRYILERGESKLNEFTVPETTGMRFVEQVKRDDLDLITKQNVGVAKRQRKAFSSFEDLTRQLTKISENLTNVNTRNEIQKLTQEMASAGIIKEVEPGKYDFVDTARGKVDQVSFGSQLSETASNQIEVIKAVKSRSAPRQFERSVEEILGELTSQSGIYRRQQEDIFGRRLYSQVEVNKGLLESLFKKGTATDTSRRVASGSGRLADLLLETAPRDMSLNTSLQKATQKSLGKFFGMYAAGAGMLGGFSVIKDNFYPDRKSNLLVKDYDSWFEKQAQVFGNNDAFLTAIKQKYNIEGMHEGGLAADLRKANTDFGSPYAGPEYSHEVLNQNKVYRMRQKVMSQAFYDRHFDQGDIGNLLSKFKSAFKHEVGTNIKALYPYTSPIDIQKYQNLKGNNLVKLNLKEGYKLSMEDADTLTIKGAGNNPLNSFMGSNKYSFRLAGIDSPETSHEGRGAQPYAEEAKRIAQAIIKRAKNVEIVVKPDEVTYGRQVAMVYADGINVNLELIKRGAAAYLPYRSKQSPNMYNEQAFEKAQEMAQKHERGMWRTAYFKGYRDIVQASGQSVTFNKLANVSSVAQSSSLMSMYSLMNNAEAAGFYNNAMAMEAANIGNRIGALGNRAFKPDARAAMHHENHVYTVQNKPYYREHIDSINSEIINNIKSRGSNRVNKTSARSIVRNNKLLADNALNQYKNIWNEEKYRMSSIMKSSNRKINRMKDMEFLQQEALRDLNRSPIGHWRM